MQFIAENRMLVGLVWTVLAAILAVVWLKVVPGKVESVPAPQAAVLRYAHPCCWALLAIAGVVYAVGLSPVLVTAISLTALSCYIAFLAALII